jgi:flagellar basal-body rod protein FlgG
MRALYTAATGMKAQELNVEVISNNIANLRTTGFKRQRAQFQDLLYQTFRRPGATASADGAVVPAELAVGTGVKPVSTPRTMTQGNVTPTERQLDLAIRGEGFFQVRLPDGRTAYTRDGSFTLDPQGQIVTADGAVLEPGITVPANAEKVTINAQGLVEVTLPGQTQGQQVGQITLARFPNSVGLLSIGDNLFLETTASGAAVAGNPASEGMGNLLQGHLEEANVNAVTEISSLIAAQRAYEMNARVISAADQMLAATSQMLRG